MISSMHSVRQAQHAIREHAALRMSSNTTTMTVFIDRLEQVNTALKEEMKDIHALSIQHCWTPEQDSSHAATAS